MTYFALVGNGPITNRGCEAIVLGTKQIIEKEFGPSDILLASFAQDPKKELPARVKPLFLPFLRKRWSIPWFKYRVNRLLGKPDDIIDVVRPLRDELNAVNASLTIGGDGYSIDYGHIIIDCLVVLDKYIQSRGIPVIIWGASIGPFDQEPQFEKQMAAHFSNIELIVVRDPASLQYLHNLGINNVLLAPDPAFVLEPKPCPLPAQVEKFLSNQCIGVNLSPLLSKNATGGNLEEWISLAAKSLSKLISKVEMPILLIPHVTSPRYDPGMDDELFLKNVMAQVPESLRSQISLVPGVLNSENLKWVIGQTTVFIGARTHSTIAALSMKVPCVSIAYSLKAWGINEYVFGNTDWVFSSTKFSPDEFCSCILEVLGKRDHIRSHLLKVVPDMISSAYGVAKEIRRVSRSLQG